MIKDILDGVKEVVFEIGTGMAESCQTISVSANKIYDDINVKLMGSYEEIDAFEKAKESAVKIEK
jgi:hypothetical protein